jgi:hypothetical protein
MADRPSHGPTAEFGQASDEASRIKRLEQTDPPICVDLLCELAFHTTDESAAASAPAEGTICFV